MSGTIAQDVQAILAKVPQLYRGPSGAVAVLKDGELVGQHVWGYADLSKGIPLTADTHFPICSISKQMVCGLLRDLERNPTPAMRARGDDPVKVFSDELQRLLRPELFQGTGLELRHLCDNKSGIRDYWALTVLWGAMPDGRFSMAEHCPAVFERLRSLHFRAGSEHSYANTNFCLIGLMIENVTNQTLAELLVERIFAPAGMATARLGPDTAALPPPMVGYEGDEARGYFPAVNRIEWAGDAGIIATLSDMVAYEKFIDRSQSDPQSWYRANTQMTPFADGNPSEYANGLGQSRLGSLSAVGHGGALRGFRLNRRYVASERLSVVVMFNSELDAGAAAGYITRQILKIPEPQAAPVAPVANWLGNFLDPETQMAIIVSQTPPTPRPAVQTGQAAQGSPRVGVTISYRGFGEAMKMTAPDAAECPGMTAKIDQDTLHLRRSSDNRTVRAQRIAPAEVGPNEHGLAGDYRSAEIDSVFHCSGQDGLLYGSFDGFLGQGPQHLMRSLGKDVWVLTCMRSMDSTPPGYWTVVVKRDEGGAVSGLIIGCWLARRVEFTKTG